MSAQLKQSWWRIRDWVFPRLDPLSEEEAARQSALAEDERKKIDEQIKTFADEDDILTQYAGVCARLLDEAEDTRRSVETRLTTIIGLSSIAGTIVFGGTLATVTGTLQVSSFLLRLFMSVGALYLVVQIGLAVRASLRGLERRGYIAAQASEVVPSTGETRSAYLRRQISLSIRRLADVRSHNNDKVSQMALAHCAMRNFVTGLMLLAAIGTGFAIPMKNPTDNLIQTLEQNKALYEMLRGPEGPKGDPGPTGPAGPVAEPKLQSSPRPPKK